MLVIVLVVTVLLHSCSCSGAVREERGVVESNNATLPSENRDQRFLSLFTVVRFSNAVCTSTITNMTGTCVTSAECSTLSGTSAGSCASGFGVCCVIMATCGSTVNRNSTFFVNPGGTGSTYTGLGQCSLQVQKCSSDICQLRLDFKTFTLAQPVAGDQTCTQDQFIVSGASNPVPSICGDNSGQHMYLDMKSNTNTWTLTVTTSATTGTSVSRQWTIAIYQIPCDSRLVAPDQCLQYYTGASGTIKSFNFAFVAAPSIGTPGATATTGRQLANQDYTMCIRMEDGFCSITYSVCPDPLNTSPISSAFTISLSFTQGTATPATTPGDVYNVIDNGGNGDFCIYDWLEIPRGQATISPSPSSAVTYDRFCGTALGFNFDGSVTAPQASVPVTSYRKPFELYYHTNAFEASQVDPLNAQYPDFSNHGFCLNYVENPC